MEEDQDLFQLVQKAISLWQQQLRDSISSEQRAACEEFLWRLQELDDQYKRLQEINEALTVIAMQALPTMSVDSNTNQLVVRGADGVELCRFNPKDPKTAPTLVQSAFKSTFPAGGNEAAPGGQKELALRRELERLIESFYYGAFRLTKLVQKLPGQKKFPYIGITMVRNDLIEHPKDGARPPNFGFGTGGPFVRPVRSSGVVLDDKGLVANTRELLELIQVRFPT